MAYGFRGKTIRKGETTHTNAQSKQSEDNNIRTETEAIVAGHSNMMADPKVVPVTTIPKREPAVPLTEGICNAEFRDDRYDWDGKYHLQIGASTRMIIFDTRFNLAK